MKFHPCSNRMLLLVFCFICSSASAVRGQVLENVEKKLLFFPTKTLIATPGDIGLKYDDLFLPAPIVGNAKTSLFESASPSPAAPRNLKINAWWIPAIPGDVKNP